MSEEEKALQIAKAVKDYQKAKADCGHIEKKIETAFRDLLAIGQLGASRGAYSISVPDYREELCFDTAAMSFTFKELPGGAELAAMVKERDKAHKAKLAAQEEMDRLGINLK